MAIRLSAYIKEPRVIHLGAGKNTKYAFLSKIPDIEQPLVIREIDKNVGVSITEYGDLP